jgi:hypothetical protein
MLSGVNGLGPRSYSFLSRYRQASGPLADALLEARNDLRARSASSKRDAVYTVSLGAWGASSPIRTM